MTHLEIAARDGMKAGFKAYTRTLVRSQLPQVVETRETLERMGKRAAFAWYCAKHGPDVIAFPPEAEPEVAPLASEIEAARARLAELEAQAAKPKRTHTRSSGRTSKPEAVKENLWREWAIRKHSIPTKVGATFTYKGKRRTSTFKVTRVTNEGVYTVRAA